MNVRAMVVGVIVFCLAAGIGFAQSRTTITVGANYWYAAPDYKGWSFKGIDVGPGNMFGPYISLRAGRVTLGSSLFFGSFQWKSGLYEGVHRRLDLEVKRNDLNFSVGYIVFRNLNVFGALKSVSLKGEKTFAFLEDYALEYKGTLYGGGFSSAVRFHRSPLFIFWSAAYLQGTMKKTERGNERSIDTQITSLTIGLGFQIPSGLALLVGYRADLGSRDAAETKVQGPLATLAYTIR